MMIYAAIPWQEGADVQVQIFQQMFKRVAQDVK